MLVQLLPEFSARFNVRFELYLMYEHSEINYASKLWREWAIKDANQFAQCYGLVPIKQAPLTKSLVTGQQLWQLETKNIPNAAEIFDKTWHNLFTEFFAPSTPVISFQIKNQQRQLRKGHYQSASLYFAGEWYVGIERLDHLEHRLNKVNYHKGPAEFKYNLHHLRYLEDFVSNKDDELTIYLSIHSPYAYLGWLQAQKLCQHYRIALRVKIVLPLLMRGINVPIEKQRYVLFDAIREARVKDLPIDDYFEPIVAGVINSYQVFPFAEQQNKAVAFIDAIFNAIYVQGRDLSKVRNIKAICRAIDLNYDEAISYALEHDWQKVTDENQKQLEQLGFWGVPCFTFGQTSCWGQDRLFQIENAILAQQ
ncbi:MAG: DsbA family protein [Thalassotalea sp.]